VAIGYIIDPARHRQGIATEAVTAMLDFCYGALGLHRVQALIHPDNTASRALVEKLGFREEGLLRYSPRVGEAWRDDMLYALLAKERSEPRPHPSDRNAINP
jgi:ribosomal-protein-alanine N-acetyltransferase